MVHKRLKGVKRLRNALQLARQKVQKGLLQWKVLFHFIFVIANLTIVLHAQEILALIGIATIFLQVAKLVARERQDSLAIPS